MVDVRRLSVGEDDDQVAISLDELAREGAASDDRGPR